jgi:hypothetical protein
MEDGQDGFEEYRCDGVDHWQVVAIDPELEPVVKRLPAATVDQRWARVSRFILFDQEAVARDFSLTAVALPPGDARALVPAARSQVDLVPTTAEMRQHLQGVIVQFDERPNVVAVRIRDNSDNLMTAVIQEADYVTPIPDRLFRWGTGP